MKILTLDIETSPNVVYTFDLWKTTISSEKIIKPTTVLCFAAKWLGEDEVLFYSLFSDGQEYMLEKAWELLDEADVVVHYNGQKFDIPHLNREFALQGWEPPSPFKQIDLYRTVASRFNFPSNKLSYVSKAFGLSGKIETFGFELWEGCLNNDPESWAEMEEYNRQDVVVTEELYECIKAWIPSHPVRGLYDGLSGCPLCGSSSLQKRGFAYTQVSKYQQWQCQDCKSYHRSKSLIRGVDIRPVAVT